MSILTQEIAQRRTFAIISHPDAGKTTLTEKLLLYGGAIQLAGAVKGRKASRHATSDWMELEKERGISITTSVMQFEHRGKLMNLLDTPGHADFSEDTYRTLTAVDSALMVIDCTKGVEARTRQLMEVCRMRQMAVMTFINKLDREGRDPLELLDEIEKTLGLRCVPITWPIGMGKRFCGVYHLLNDTVRLFERGQQERAEEGTLIQGLENAKLDELLGDQAEELREAVAFIRGVCEPFDHETYLRGEQTPVFFGSALYNFGVIELLDAFAEYAPPPQPRKAQSREVPPEEPKVAGFVFKVQANMDPNHHDRIAFVRICSGRFRKGMKLYHVESGKWLSASTALTFQAQSRRQIEEAYPGDIIGLPNHGTIAIADTFTEGEVLKFEGIPHFAPELFRRVVLKDPLRSKALYKGLKQLSEEGAVQLFRPLKNNDLILGAVGPLQFDVTAYRLRSEYRVECQYEPVQVYTARWIECDDPKKLEEFKRRCYEYLAEDGAGHLVYLAPSRVNLELAEERWSEIQFKKTREI